VAEAGAHCPHPLRRCVANGAPSNPTRDDEAVPGEALGGGDEDAAASPTSVASGSPRLRLGQSTGIVRPSSVGAAVITRATV
jgi:hypothetical protein